MVEDGAPAWARAMEERVLGEIGALRDELRTEIGTLRDELRTEIGTLRDELRTEIGTLRDELRTEIGTLRDELRSEIEALRAEVNDLRSQVERLRSEHIRTRADIMERIDRLQFRVDSHADDIKVALGAAHMLEDRVKTRDDAVVDRELARDREIRGQSDLITAMQRQIMRLQTEMAELRGRLGEA
jgi:chromosome segregation ATPase